MKKSLSKKIVSLVTVFALAVALLPTTLVSADTSPVTAEKSSKWVDLNNQIAEISVKVNAKDQIVTEKTDIVFAIDASTTMMIDDMDNAKAAISKFTDSIASNPNTKGKVKIGLVKYGSEAETILGLTSNYTSVKKQLDGDLQWYKLLFNATNIQAGIKKSEDMLKNSTATNKYIIVIGDGEPTKSFKVTKGDFVNTSYQSDCEWHKGFFGLGAHWEHKIKAQGTFVVTECNYNNIDGTGLSNTILLPEKFTKKINGKCQHGNNCSDDIEYIVSSNNTATLFEAGLAKNAGIKMFSIGYGVNGGNAETVLKGIADSGCYFKSNKNGTEINNAVNNIKNKIVKEVSQGTNASLTEASSSIKIGGTTVDYQIVAGSIRTTQGTATNSGNSINWAIGNLPNGSATLTYRVKITTPLPTGNNTITLGSANLNYKNISGAAASAPSATTGEPLQYSKHTVKFIGYEENADRQLVEKVLVQDDYFEGETVNAPALTETAGYTFAWPETSVVVSDDNKTVTAVATKKSFDVKFYGFDGNQIGETQNIKYLESATAPADPTVVDKDFTGWGTEAWKSVTGNTDVYPNGTIKKFNVSYEVKNLETGETTPIDITNDVDYNTASSTLTAPEFTLPEGYEVATEWTLPENITSDITVTKTIQKKTFKVEFKDYNGNTIGDVQVIKYGDSAVEPAKPVDATKTFTKWSTEEWKEVKSDLTVTAEFTAVVNIDDDDTPLVNIPDDDVPTASNPKTGNEYFTVILMLVAFAAATTTLILKKKAQVK